MPQTRIEKLAQRITTEWRARIAAELGVLEIQASAAVTQIEVIKERQRSDAEALLLAKSELSRRLEDLNHAHADARARDAAYVTRDIHDRLEGTINEWRRGVDAALLVLQTRRDVYVGLMAGALSLIAIGIEVAQYFKAGL